MVVCLMNTYVLEAVFAERCHEMQETEQREPGHPAQDLLDVLDIHHSEDEDEFVEDEIPELVFQVLFLRNSQLAKNHQLYEFPQQRQ